MSCFSALGRERDAGISLAARCHSFLYRRPTRQSSLLHVYTMVFACFFFPWLSLGLRHPTWCAASSKRVSRFFPREFTHFFPLIVSFSSASIIWRGVFQTGFTVSQGSSRIVSQLCLILPPTYIWLLARTS